MVSRYLENSLGYAVYRKANHIDRYLQTSSYHPKAHKRSIIITLMDRTNTIWNNISWALELHVRSVLWVNGYCLQDLNRMSKARPVRRRTTKKSNHCAHIPYVQGTPDCMSRLLQNHDIHTTQTRIQKPASKLNSAIDRQLRLKNQVFTRSSVPVARCTW